MTSCLRSGVICTAIGISVLCVSCRKATQEPETLPPQQPVAGATGPPIVAAPATALVTFPDEVRSEDPSVNTFVQSALENCATDRYEAFRSVWTAREEPISRDEFDKGWHAAKAIQVRALEKVKLSSDSASAGSEVPREIAYALVVGFSLDPEQQVSQRKSQREIVLLLNQENGQWRLGRAPKNMREWVKKKIGDEDSRGKSEMSGSRVP